MTYPTPDIWYKFENNILDSSGNNKHLTPVNSPTYSTSKTGLGYCKGPEAADSNYYLLPNFEIENNEIWTMSFWMMITDSDGGWLMNYGSYLDRHRFEIGSSYPQNIIINGHRFGYTFNYDTWYHVAIEWNGWLWTLFINANYYSYYNIQSAKYPTNTVNFFLAQDTGELGFKGKFDNFMFWRNLNLSAEELQEAMDETNPPPPDVSIGGATMNKVIIGG